MVARQIFLYGLVLLPMSLFPTLVGLAGKGYFYGALIAGGVFLTVSVKAARSLSRQASRRLFLASVIYLPVILVLLSLDKGTF